MSWVEQTLADFGRGIGIEGLSFNPQGVVRLTIESMGTLYIEQLEDAVLLYLVRELAEPIGERYSLALSSCHWDQNRPLPVQPALRHDRQLLFSVRLAIDQFTLPELEAAITLLNRMHDETQAGVSA